jgi:hypothetical protein
MLRTDVYVRFEVLTAVVITQYSPLKVILWFGRPCRLLLQDRKISQARNQPALLATCLTFVSCFAYSLTLKMATTYSSDTSVGFKQTTLRYIPDDRALLMQVFKCLSLYPEDGSACEVLVM